METETSRASGIQPQHDEGMPAPRLDQLLLLFLMLWPKKHTNLRIICFISATLLTLLFYFRPLDY